MKIRQLVVIMGLLTGPVVAQQKTTLPGVHDYKSPDGILIGAVLSSNTSPSRYQESSIELRTTAGSVLVRASYVSDDGTHGYTIAEATWTPDSQFFVYSLENSGGHSPWHTPIQFYNRKLNKIFSLDDLVNDAVMSPHFQISAPDKITVELYFAKKRQTITLSSLTNN